MDTINDPSRLSAEQIDYASYLSIDKLLSLQRPRSNSHFSETLFIIIHQVSELYFKLLLENLNTIEFHFKKDQFIDLGNEFARAKGILEFLSQQLYWLATHLTLKEFLSFRDVLGTASGIQSVQYRAIEHRLGNKRNLQQENLFTLNKRQNKLLQNSLTQPSICYHFFQFLQRHGVKIEEEFMRNIDTYSVENNHRLIDIPALIKLYQENPMMTHLFDEMINFDDAYLRWKYEHTSLARRMLGNKRGTGGTSGLNYLQKRLSQSIFPLLWDIRTKF